MKSSLLSVLVSLVMLLIAPAARAQQPLSDILEDMGDDTLDQVKNWASTRLTVEQGQGEPLYKSTRIERLTFEGDFIPNSNQTQLAIFSDDGCTVTINGATASPARAGKGQHLPDLTQSFQVVADATGNPYGFQQGQTYHMKISYTNTIYNGGGDIDGCTLFAYNDGGSAREAVIDEVATMAGPPPSDQTSMLDAGAPGRISRARLLTTSPRHPAWLRLTAMQNAQAAVFGINTGQWLIQDDPAATVVGWTSRWTAHSSYIAKSAVLEYKKTSSTTWISAGSAQISTNQATQKSTFTAATLENAVGEFDVRFRVTSTGFLGRTSTSYTDVWKLCVTNVILNKFSLEGKGNYTKNPANGVITKPPGDQGLVMEGQLDFAPGAPMCPKIQQGFIQSMSGTINAMATPTGRIKWDAGTVSGLDSTTYPSQQGVNQVVPEVNESDLGHYLYSDTEPTPLGQLIKRPASGNQVNDIPWIQSISPFREIGFGTKGGQGNVENAEVYYSSLPGSNLNLNFTVWIVYLISGQIKVNGALQDAIVAVAVRQQGWTLVIDPAGAGPWRCNPVGQSTGPTRNPTDNSTSSAPYIVEQVGPPMTTVKP